jgi:hypothetical protein
MMGTEPMDAVVRRWVVEALGNHPRLLALAVRQRAKWEGWLKFELAARAEREGFVPVRVEAAYGQSRADVTLHRDGERYDVELKTPNANWRIDGVERKGRPITKNIADIILDARKLALAPGTGIVCFALFPVPRGGNEWKTYLARIAGQLGVPLSESLHCTRVAVDLGGGNACEVVVCAFPYPAAEATGMMARVAGLLRPRRRGELPRRSRAGAGRRGPEPSEDSA